MEDKFIKLNKIEEYIREWKALIEALPYPVSIHDTEYNVIMANRSFIDICGREDDVRGEKCYKLIHHKDMPVEDCPMAKTLKSGNPEKAEIYEPLLKKYILVHTSPIKHEGSLIGVIHSVVDITKVKVSEESYKELTEVLGESLNEIKKRESDIQRSRDAFLNMLEDIHESYKELENLFISFVTAMVSALDAKSPWTKGHTERVTSYALEIAKELGMKEEELEHLKLCCLLHDIGKIGIYDKVLDKPGKLTDEEFEIIKKHPEKGTEILNPIKQLSKIMPGILHHHERYDGKGYPQGLMGEDIPLCARILHVADSFDAMTADRPYRYAPGVEYAISEFKKFAGLQFDPNVVKAFLKILEFKKEIKKPARKK